MTKDVSTYIKNCEICNKWKRSVIQPPIQPIIANDPLERLQIDFTEPGIDELGKRYLLLCIDSFSKFVWGQAFETKDAENVATFLLDLFLKEGFPQILQNDNGGEFVGKVIQILLEKCRVRQIKIGIYHPQSNGQIERSNHTIKTRLAMMTSENQQPWSLCLPFVLHAYNNSVHSTTGATPMEILKGRAIITLEGRTVQEMLVHQAQIRDRVRAKIKQAAQRMVERRMKKTKVIVYEIGDIVLVKKRKKGKNGPLYQYEGEIVQATRNYRYKVKWIGDGPNDETDNCISKKFYTARDLKLKRKGFRTPIRSRKDSKRKNTRKRNIKEHMQM